MPKIKETKKQPKQIEDYKPGATREQLFEALRIAATTEIKPKPDSKKPS